ncbi:MAG: hypothetical protein E6Q66_03240, partial [Pedobacter sp.]
MIKNLLNKFLKIARSSVLLLVCITAFAQTPTISSFNPTSGSIGTSVTIIGQNFNSTPALNVVFFGATQATVTNATSTTLTMTVPYGTNYQYISVTNLGNSLTAYSNVPFVSTFQSDRLTDFTNDQNFTSASYTKGVSVGDLNGDGKPDLVVANANNGYVSIYTNSCAPSGSLSFTLVNTVALTGGAYAEQISILDLDGDGKPDLAVARANNGTSYAASDNVQLFRNITTASSSTITFTLGPVLTAASGVSIADFDGDGKPDIASINGIQNRISVFRNLSVSGTLSFTTTAQTFNFTANSTANFIAVGDLDRDGKPDIVVSTSANTLSLFHNQSTPGNINFMGTFASSIDLPIGFTAYGIAIGDFDNDGNPDIVVTDQTNGRIVFYRNTNNSTTGTISFPSILSFAFATAGGSASTGSLPNANLSIADFDGDGKIDVAVANETASVSTLLVLKNTSSGIGNLNFSNRIVYSTGSTNAWNLVASDMNADGKPDIIVSNYAGNTGIISLFRNLSVLSPPVITSVTPLSATIGSVITINGQNFNTNPLSNTVFFGSTLATVQAGSTSTTLLVTVPYGANYQYISVTNLAVNLTAYSAIPFVVTYPTSIGGSNDYAPALSIRMSGTGSPNQQVIKDFNGDGKPDIVVGTSNGLYLLTNRTAVGSNAVTFSIQAVTISTGVNIRALAGDDLDGDGMPDLALNNSTNSWLMLYKNVSSIGGSISFSNTGINLTSSSFYSVVISDIDADGRPDIVMGGNTSAIYVYRNTSALGTINFASPLTSFVTSGSALALAIGDIDGDGKPDLVTANYTSTNNLSVLRNTTTGPGSITFASMVNFTGQSNQYSRSLALGDFNGDGQLDVAVDNYGAGSFVSLFTNTAISGTINTNSFGTSGSLGTAGSNTEAVAIGDMNGDGKPDLVSAAYNTTVVSLFKNTSTSSSITFTNYVAYTDPNGTNGTSVGNNMSLADLNGDGLLDIVRCNNSSNNLSIFPSISIPPPVLISDFTPKQGSLSTTVTITGSNFNANPLSNTVFFGSTAGIVQVGSTSTSLIVTVPYGANYQYISVTNLGTKQTAYSLIPFIVTYPTASGSFNQFSSAVTVGGSSTNNQHVIKDFNGDGKPDIVVGTSSGLYLLTNRTAAGSNAITFTIQAISMSVNIRSLAGDDLDGDGLPDLALNNSTNSWLMLYKNVSSIGGSISFSNTGITLTSSSFY